MLLLSGEEKLSWATLLPFSGAVSFLVPLLAEELLTLILAGRTLDVLPSGASLSAVCCPPMGKLIPNNVPSNIAKPPAMRISGVHLPIFFSLLF
jgi:hypothetical protein